MENKTDNNDIQSTVAESYYYTYYLNNDNEFEQIATVQASNLQEWLQTEGMDYDQLKFVKPDGRFINVIAFGESGWDVVDRGIEESAIHEKKSFKNFIKTRDSEKKIKNSIKDKPMDQTKHHLKTARGINRKRQSYVPIYRQMDHRNTLPTADNVLKTAKSASSGAWKLSRQQVVELAGKYKFNIPTAKKHSKHLGSTGILMWRKSPKEYYLVKFSKHMDKRKK